MPGRASPPKGTFSTVSAGEYHTCGLRPGGTPECWGSNWRGQSRAREDDLSSVSAGNYYTCGVQLQGAVKCWGEGSPRAGPQGEFTSVDAAAEHACGVRPDGEAVCWNVDSFGKATVPDTSRYISVSIGGGHACGINGMRELICWGENYTDYGEKTAPQGLFTTISAGSHHTCGLRPDGRVECWNGNDHSFGGPGNIFVSLHTLEDRTCGTRTDGSQYCWRRLSIQEEVPSTCDPWDYSSHCWEYGSDGVPPAGEISKVAIGNNHTCGLLKDGTAQCWGFNKT